ncbi:dienelactone hydrolase family protein [bacterium]|nr:dienelactone hydrolase family protein [bacterium]
MRFMSWLLAAIAGLTVLTQTARAEMQTATVAYEHDGVTLEGYVAYDDNFAGPRPGVLIVHQWKGLSDYEIKRAHMLASLGYVAFCADIYGQGVRPQTAEEAAQQAGLYRADRPLMRARAQAGLDALKAQPRVDPARTAAIGYCFGGGVVLELARSGADTRAVISFHGNLDTPDPADAHRIKAAVLACHGAADPHVPPEQVAAFAAEMNAAGVDWQLIMYGGAVHSFTDWNAGSDPAQGVAYDGAADRRSWADMLQLFGEVF